MRSVAFLAGWGIRIILAVQLSVNAGKVQLANFIVAGGAIHAAGDGLAGAHAGGIYLRVALAARNLAVARMAHFVGVHDHGLPITRAPQFLVSMATHAVGVSHAHLIE